MATLFVLTSDAPRLWQEKGSGEAELNLISANKGAAHQWLSVWSTDTTTAPRAASAPLPCCAHFLHRLFFFLCFVFLPSFLRPHPASSHRCKHWSADRLTSQKLWVPLVNCSLTSVHSISLHHENSFITSKKTQIILLKRTRGWSSALNKEKQVTLELPL